MAVAEKIYEHLQKLPESLQAEVLDFVAYLEAKSARESAADERLTHSEISLALAMRGLEEEPVPEYTPNDVKEHF